MRINYLNMKYICSFTCLLLLFISISCNRNNDSKTEKIQKQRNNIINVADKINDVKPKIIFGNSALFILDKYLIVLEKFPKGDKGIHLFDKNTFRYITSTGIIGKGPGEIISPGPLGLNKEKKVFWVPDAGKRVLFEFPLDSILNNNKFKPTIWKKMQDKTTTLSYDFLNDSIVLGIVVNLTSNTSFKMVMSKLNINTDQISKFGYEHPKAIGKKSYSTFAMSVENNFYVNCHSECDLMTICDLEGNLKYNVYGPGWFDNEHDKNSYFFDVDLFGSNIIASYIGSKGIIARGNITRGAPPTKFIVFDMEGKYLKTIETGFEFESFCVDEENKRIIAYFTNRDEPLGYFNISL